MVLFWSKKIMNRGVKILSKKAALDILSTKKWFFYQRLEEHVYLASIYKAHGVLNIINEKNLCPLWPHKIKIMVLKWKLTVTSWVVSLLDNAPTTYLVGYVIPRWVDLPMSYISLWKKNANCESLFHAKEKIRDIKCIKIN